MSKIKNNELLIIAAERNDLKKVTLLLKRGTNINYKNYDGESPLSKACFMGHYEMVKLLIDNNANINIKNSRDHTARRLPGTLAEVTSPRTNVIGLLSAVRGFYLDIAQWATEDPARWGPWAAPCPVTEADVSSRKFTTRRKARMDQRTRERLDRFQHWWWRHIGARRLEASGSEITKY